MIYVAKSKRRSVPLFSHTLMQKHAYAKTVFFLYDADQRKADWIVDI